MSHVFKILLLILITYIPLLAQGSFNNQIQVFSSGGGWTGNAFYQQYHVIGEPLVNTYISNSNMNGSLGFIFNDDIVVVAPPKRAILIYPPNNSLFPSELGILLDISFYWVEQENVTFNLQVANDRNFFNLFIDTTISNNYCTVSIPESGDMFWRVKASKNELSTDWSDIWKFSILVTGIAEDAIVNIYPNPVLQYVQIVLENNLANGEIIITDMFGNVKYSNSAKGNFGIIDLSNFESGIYLLTVTNGRNQVRKKLIKI